MSRLDKDSRRLARSAVGYAIATALSRIAGLVREALAAGYFGISGAVSAFTIAFQIPNLVRALVADTALEGAIVPVMTEALQREDRRRAVELFSGLVFALGLALGAITLLFILAAPVIVPLFAPGLVSDEELVDLLVGLARVMFPSVMLLTISGVLVGTLYSHDRFAAGALGPLVWNLVVIAAIVVFTPFFDEQNQLYAYAVGVLVGSAVQLLLPIPWLKPLGVSLTAVRVGTDPLVRKALKLMLPVALALGLVNFSGLCSSAVGSLVDADAPAVIDKAFRIYMLPLGLFAVPVSAIIFPTLARQGARSETEAMRRTLLGALRHVLLFLLPASALLLVLADPITQVVYERGKFTTSDTGAVATALAAWSLSLPFHGASSLYSRTFFALQMPWRPALIAGSTLVANVVLALLLFKPFGVTGVVLASAASVAAGAVVQHRLLRRLLAASGGPSPPFLAPVAKMLFASVISGTSAAVCWNELRPPQEGDALATLLPLAASAGAGLLAYVVTAMAIGVGELRLVAAPILDRLRRMS